MRHQQHLGRIILVGILMGLTVLPASPASALKIVHIDFLFGISADLKAPSDVAVTGDGRIHVVDGVNSRIKTFTPDGKVLSAFGEGGSSNGQFQSPLGIDVDASGRIYIADSGNHRVQIFDHNAAFVAKIDLPGRNGRPADPTDVAVDPPRDRLYVVDNDNHRFLVYRLSTLKLIRTIGKPGEQELMFRYPFLAALNESGYLYVVDVINTRVQAISPDGLFVAYLGSWGVEKGHFFRPKGVAVDRNDRVYVSDSYMGVIQVFDAWGEFHGVLGDAGGKTVQRFRTPVGLFIDDRNRLYVVEMLAGRVSVYGIRVQGR